MSTAGGAGAGPALRIATRSSPQARTQAEAVAEAIRRARPGGIEVELVFVDTTGDRRQDVPLHQIGGQGVFVKEVQQAVLDGRADLAAHSAKDLPSVPTPGLVIGAFCARRSACDALVGRPLAELATGATVATGSVRRRAQLAALRPDLVFSELRGNIGTRLSKVPDGGAVVMAVAALEVLGMVDEVRDHHGLDVLPVEVAVPMVGQGCVAVECADDAPAHVVHALAAVDHAPTRRAVEVERAFLATLGSGCSLPVGAHAVDGRLLAFLGSEAAAGTAASVRRTIDLTGDLPTDRELARELAAAMRAELDRGAR